MPSCARHAQQDETSAVRRQCNCSPAQRQSAGPVSGRGPGADTTRNASPTRSPILPSTPASPAKMARSSATRNVHAKAQPRCLATTCSYHTAQHNMTQHNTTHSRCGVPVQRIALAPHELCPWDCAYEAGPWNQLLACTYKVHVNGAMCIFMTPTCK
jgi:hypothetical protein